MQVRLVDPQTMYLNVPLLFQRNDSRVTFVTPRSIQLFGCCIEELDYPLSHATMGTWVLGPHHSHAGDFNWSERDAMGHFVAGPHSDLTLHRYYWAV